MPLFEPILAALNRTGVRYVVVGGVAVVLHGHVRLTADLDLVVDLTPSEARNGAAPKSYNWRERRYESLPSLISSR